MRILRGVAANRDLGVGYFKCAPGTEEFGIAEQFIRWR